MIFKTSNSEKIGESTIKVLIYGKLGTFNKVEVVLDAVSKIREMFNASIEVVIAGSDSHLAEGYIQNVQNKYKSMKGITYLGDVSKIKLASIMTQSLVVKFPYMTQGKGQVYSVPSQIFATSVHKLNDFSRLAIEREYDSVRFIPSSKTSLTQAIYQLAIIERQKTA